MDNQFDSFEEEYNDFLNRSIMKSNLDLQPNSSIELSEAIQFVPSVSLSDLDRGTDGSFGIEWQYEDGARWWQWFNTEEERKEALDEWSKRVDVEEVEFKKSLKGRIFQSVDY